MKLFLAIFCIALALLLFLSVIVYFILSDKRDKKQALLKQENLSDLESLISAASRASDEELKELVKLYLQDYKLGLKISANLDELTKKKLEFVSTLAANPQASAKTISYLNKELKQNSSSYKQEIDAYEYMGLAKRMQ
ncbi:hypothetical protein [Campylobacter sp. VTCC 70190]|uniref:hypothetical protein n=1 Tax=Campylobacter sp. VTCC 70190 TaxID=3392118 RepID=UPI00398F3818